MKDPKIMTDQELEREIEKRKSVSERILDEWGERWLLEKEKAQRIKEEIASPSQGEKG